MSEGRWGQEAQKNGSRKSYGLCASARHVECGEALESGGGDKGIVWRADQR